ncbi:MAG: PIN domain-containing protein [Fimbriimonas sp.]|nr:PIN domain-containing protein [Fimbriimonas sp.]
MKLADTNIWLALALSGHEHHARVSEWIRQLSSEPIAFCRMTQVSTLRLLTTRAVFTPFGIPPLSNGQAWEIYRRFRADSRVVFVLEPPELDDRWRELSDGPLSSPKQWMDAYLAAFAIAGGHQLVSTDSAFTAIQGLDLLVLG